MREERRPGWTSHGFGRDSGTGADQRVYGTGGTPESACRRVARSGRCPLGPADADPEGVPDTLVLQLEQAALITRTSSRTNLRVLNAQDHRERDRASCARRTTTAQPRGYARGALAPRRLPTRLQEAAVLSLEARGPYPDIPGRRQPCRLAYATGAGCWSRLIPRHRVR